MKAVIVANGELEAGEWWREEVAGAAWLIAADGGSKHALQLGLRPQYVVGDLDSLDAETVAQLEAGGAQVIRHSPRKDESDTELACKLAVSLGATELCLLGALGGRFDHALANILLLSMPELAGLRARIVTRESVLTLIRKEASFTGQAGDILSLLPLGGPVTGIVTEGLEYPLRGETLSLGPARGISNVLTGPVARVRVESGLLLAIQFRARDPHHA